ncbi:MAG: DUF2071 domain-containing protein [Planctomycetota bacterium]|nr:DUF2071 domain-containing protein [Planctomycetota bacterium]MDA1177682.1 DUF2071 domain-containing protein [Planctomycetota bacterium]
MHLPVIRGTIDRRILLNYRVDPKILADLLPAPFRPLTIDGCGIAGICLIRLRQIRPRFLPRFAGITSENAAHRIAVQWNTNGHIKTGVFIPRRDTSSLLNALAGGRIFPGEHHRARFEVHEDASHFRVGLQSHDGSVRLTVDAEATSGFPSTSIFPSLEDASRFFESGSMGYSPRSSNGGFDCLELRARNWRVSPLAIHHVESSFFDDRTIFPRGAIALDNALLMLNIDHEWHSQSSWPSFETSSGSVVA